MKGGELVFSARYCGASPKRLDEFVSDITSFTRSRARNLILDGCVTVCDKEVVKAGYMIRSGDNVTVIAPPPKKLDLSPSDHKVPIVYQDEDIAIVDKPQGMVVHPAPGSYGETLVNSLLGQLDSLSGINGIVRPGIVHRLDKDTSGLLVVAKNDRAHLALQSQIAEKEARRTYVALLDGVVKKDSGRIENYLDRSPKDRKRYAVSRANTGRLAITDYSVLKRYPQYTFARFDLQTGRTHQIRVHAKYLGHPVVGDPLYGGSNAFGLDGQLLHACKLTITHPRTGEEMTFRSPLPEHFKAVIDLLDAKYGGDVIDVTKL